MLVGAVLGVAIGWLLGQRKKAPVQTDGDWEARWRELDKEKSILEERIQNSLNVFNQQKQDMEEERATSSRLKSELSALHADYRNLEEKLQSHQGEMEQLQKKFTTEFENIASRILKQNTTEFTATNTKSLGDILNPLKEKLASFEKKVEETHREELRDKASLKQQVKDLMDMNQRLSAEAANLTNALKGDNRQQGNWGELVLERVLELSGLEKGREYLIQENITGEDGQAQRPDVIIRLPEGKHLIIDAKVSLVHYETYVNAKTEEVGAQALKSHLLSIRRHVESLGKKKYYASGDLVTPDFVLLFFPLEPAFNLAMKEDSSLFGNSWDNRILLVTPTTLLATLRTVANLWRQERQNRNVIKIAEEGGKLYDKFVGFLHDLNLIGKHLKNSQEAYDNALNKLHTGKGNLVGKVENLRKLGVKAKKTIPENILSESLPDEQTSLPDGQAGENLLEE